MHSTLQLSSAYQSELRAERTQVLADIRKLEPEERKAPQAGIVKKLATTTLGAVVQPGTVLLSLVPVDEPLVAEVQVKPEDIGFVQPGQAVQVKLSAYPFQKFGMLEGTVKTVAADTSTLTPGQPANVPGAPMFKAIVQLQNQHLGAAGQALILQAGMQAQAEIRLGQRTVIEYLLSPVQGAFQVAARER